MLPIPDSSSRIHTETGESTYDRPDGMEGGGGGGELVAVGMAAGASWEGEEVTTDDGLTWEQADDGLGNFYWCVQTVRI